MNTIPNEEVSQTIWKAILGSLVYSVLFGYIILRILRLFADGGTEKLFGYMSIMLGVLNVLFVFFIFSVCFGNLLDSLSVLRAGNAGNEQTLSLSYAFLALQAIVNALPHVFNVLIDFAGLRMLNEMGTNRYSIATVKVAEYISGLCSAALIYIVLVNIAFNMLQLLFSKSLAIINSSVEIPISSVAFALAALLLTRLVTENKQLKDDNEMNTSRVHYQSQSHWKHPLRISSLRHINEIKWEIWKYPGRYTARMLRVL